MELSLEDRMRAISILVELTSDDCTFDHLLAYELIGLIPIASKNGWSVSMIRPKSRHEGISGVSPGVGEIHVANSEKKKATEFSTQVVHRIGRFNVQHVSGLMIVTMMWQGTSDAYDATVFLMYDSESMHDPTKICLLAPKTYDWSSLTLRCGGELWKLPQGQNEASPFVRQILKQQHPQKHLRISLLILAVMLFGCVTVLYFLGWILKLVFV